MANEQALTAGECCDSILLASKRPCTKSTTLAEQSLMGSRIMNSNWKEALLSWNSVCIVLAVFTVAFVSWCVKASNHTTPTYRPYTPPAQASNPVPENSQPYQQPVQQPQPIQSQPVQQSDIETLNRENNRMEAENQRRREQEKQQQDNKIINYQCKKCGTCISRRRGDGYPSDMGQCTYIGRDGTKMYGNLHDWNALNN